MKYTKCLFIRFNAVETTATINIVVPIRVKNIIVKSVNVSECAENEWALINCNLSQTSQPFAVIYMDSNLPYNGIQDIHYTFNEKVLIQGDYRFELLNYAGLPKTATNDYYVTAIVEFNDEE